MATKVVVFPFDLFGNSGAAEGSKLLADEIRTMLRDSYAETSETRALAWRDQVRLRELPMDDLSALKRWRERGCHAIRRVLKGGDRFIWLSGNHLGVLPVYEEIDSASVTVLQLDAHLDMHHFADTLDTPSHGNFLLHARQPLPKVFNVGHRDLLIPPLAIEKVFAGAISAMDFIKDEAGSLKKIQKHLQGKVFLDIDCDVMDSAYFAATGRPVPLGLSPAQMLRIFELIPTENLVGIALSEFDPSRDVSDRGLSLLIWWLEYFFLKFHE